jgi:hypothetical protein
MLMRSQLQQAQAEWKEFCFVGEGYFLGGERYIARVGVSLESFWGFGAILRGSGRGGGPMDMLAELMVMLELLASCQSAVTGLKCAVGLKRAVGWLVCDCRSVETYDCQMQSTE